MLAELGRHLRDEAFRFPCPTLCLSSDLRVLCASAVNLSRSKDLTRRDVALEGDTPRPEVLPLASPAFGYLRFRAFAVSLSRNEDLTPRDVALEGDTPRPEVLPLASPGLWLFAPLRLCGEPLPE